MTVSITDFIACPPVDWSQVEPFLPDKPRRPVSTLAVAAPCALCGIPVWLDPDLQARHPFGPVICFLCAIFITVGAARGGAQP